MSYSQPTELLRQVPMTEGMPKHCDPDWLMRLDQRQDAGLEMPAEPGPMAIWNLEGGDRLSKIHDGQYSCEWIDAISRLLFKAFHRGRPSLKAIAVYAAVWCLPFGIRSRWSNALIAQPAD